MKKVLIAEDNAVNRELLRELLEIRGYAVMEACNGEEALDQIAKIQPDILLLDLSMPVLDGFGTIDEDSKESELQIVARVGRYCVCHAGRQGEDSDLGFRRLSVEAY